MEVQDHSNPDEVEQSEDSEERIDRIVAKPGQSYPIRLIYYPNGKLIIGFVIAVFPETTMLLRPHLVDVIADETENVTEYDFTPFLDQMAHVDPTDLVPTPFMNNTMLAIVRPAEHVVRNFSDYVRLKESVASAEDPDAVEIFKRPYLNPRIRH